VVLKNHGVVAIGKNFKEAVSLIELLEEQAKVNLMLKSSQISGQREPISEVSVEHTDCYDLLSEAHRSKLVDLVNHDQEAQALGKQYDLTCTLAVKNIDTGESMCFYYEQGAIVKADSADDAEFVIIGKPEILKKVFNKELDPFVASTQGKVKTKGDFARLSRWYPVMVRTFKLWEQAPVR
jgi:putative sterol carrier protein